MKYICPLFFAAIATIQQAAQAQGTLTITFDGPPYTSGMSYYVESGMYFGVPSGNNGFGHREPGNSSGFPDNGTWYLYGGGHSGYNTIGGDFIDGSTFGVASIELAAIGGDSINISAVFRGWLSNGTLLTKSISGTGIDFRTVNFGPEWSSGLTAFGLSNDPSSPDGWSVDNLVVIVPEPATGALVLVGGLVTLAFWKRNTRR